MKQSQPIYTATIPRLMDIDPLSVMQVEVKIRYAYLSPLGAIVTDEKTSVLDTGNCPITLRPNDFIAVTFDLIKEIPDAKPAGGFNSLGMPLPDPGQGFSDR